MTDWHYTHDAQPFTLRAGTDFTGPRVVARVPVPGSERASRAVVVRARFDEPVAGVDARSVGLAAPGGVHVPARLTLRHAARVVRLVPRHRLSAGTRYRVRLSRAVTDRLSNPLRPSRTWSFVTGR